MSEPETGVIDRSEILVGAMVVALGVASAGATLAIPSAAVYAQVGPTVFPWIATAGLIALGLLLIVMALLRMWGRERDETPIKRTPLVWLVLGLILNVAVIEIAGFIPASVVLFALTARAFGSIAPIKDALVGFTLALIAFVGFDRILGYQIGTGPLEIFLSRMI